MNLYFFLSYYCLKFTFSFLSLSFSQPMMLHEALLKFVIQNLSEMFFFSAYSKSKVIWKQNTFLTDEKKRRISSTMFHIASKAHILCFRFILFRFFAICFVDVSFFSSVFPIRVSFLASYFRISKERSSNISHKTLRIHLLTYWFVWCKIPICI